MVTWQNYEEYMMMLVDGELDHQQEEALLAFVAGHPELQAELESYGKAKLDPATQVYTQKAALLKDEPARKVLAFPRWQRYSVAAGVAAIMTFGAYKMLYRGDDIVNSVAVATQAPKQAVPVPQPSAHNEGKRTQQQVTEEATGVAAVKPSAGRQQKKFVIKSGTEKTAVPVYIKEAINEMSTEGAIQLASTADNIRLEAAPAPMLSLEAPALERVEQIEKLPLGERQKEQLQELAANVANKIEQNKEAVTGAVASAFDKIQTVKAGLHDRNLVVRIEKKRLILSF